MGAADKVTYTHLKALVSVWLLVVLQLLPDKSLYYGHTTPPRHGP
jgi:hypothetical protein